MSTIFVKVFSVSQTQEDTIYAAVQSYFATQTTSGKEERNEVESNVYEGKQIG